MAKLAVRLRNEKRMRMVKKYRARREALLATLKDPNASEEEKQAARERLQRLPRDASPVRLRNRCLVTGRGRGVFRRFGLARNKLREFAMRGLVPGVIKASW